ncbi:hypothetical protein HOK51_11390 [Candidatus Woesearchaeota archaeon]|nr:hypothetical protein [Candidatus Woesearchaeota archaeon]MBT6520425.1 hypothetical protein [Candidatus Woesearchaeota archaeon]MBT7368831.1 hypothetical protein [Candidatus Woesearchaeota archaeon]
MVKDETGIDGFFRKKSQNSSTGSEPKQEGKPLTPYQRLHLAQGIVSGMISDFATQVETDTGIRTTYSKLVTRDQPQPVWELNQQIVSDRSRDRGHRDITQTPLMQITVEQDGTTSRVNVVGAPGIEEKIQPYIQHHGHKIQQLGGSLEANYNNKVE